MNQSTLQLILALLPVAERLVFDVGGNNLRVIAFIQFVSYRIYIKHIVSHAEYDKLTKYYRTHKEIL